MWLFPGVVRAVLGIWLFGGIEKEITRLKKGRKLLPFFI
jgi:hypothetical protein